MLHQARLHEVCVNWRIGTYQVIAMCRIFIHNEFCFKHRLYRLCRGHFCIRFRRCFIPTSRRGTFLIKETTYNIIMFKGIAMLTPNTQILLTRHALNGHTVPSRIPFLLRYPILWCVITLCERHCISIILSRTS